jgi:hypothetical protein
VLKLLLLLAAFAPAATKPPADKDTVKLVEMFLTTPTGDLPPEAVPAFMEVDPDTLPDKAVLVRGQDGKKPVKMKMSTGYKAKKAELEGLRLAASMKKRPGFVPLRTGKEDPKCGEPRKGTDEQLMILRFAGYQEAEERDVVWAEGEVHCSECEMETEFSLIRVAWKDPGEKGSHIRFFFHELDPVWVLIGAHRSGRSPFGTAFFGTGKPTCH